MSLDKRALGLSLNVRKPKMKKQDKIVTREVQTSKNAGTKSGKYWKELYTRNNRMIVDSPENELRTLVNEISHPWIPGMMRITPLTLYEKVENALASLVEKVRQSHEFAAQNFDQWKRDAKIDLGQMYNENDYPNEREFGRRFAVNLDVSPIPIRVPSNVISQLLDDDRKADLSELRKIVENAEKENLRCVTESCAQRIFTVTQNIIEGISHKQKGKIPGRQRSNTYHDSLIGNVWDLVQILPELNLSESQEISELHKMLRSDILAKLDLENAKSHEIEKRKKVEMARLRENTNLENEMMKAAREIMEKAAAILPQTSDNDES